MKTTGRTIAYLRKQGLLCQTVEQYNIYSRKYRDLFSIIDIILLDPPKLIGIQACGTDFQEHIRKITGEYADNARAWLECGVYLQIWGWRKLKKVKGGKAMVWKPRIQEIKMGDLK